MKKKLIFSLLTATILVSAFAGCGRNKQDNSNDDTNMVEEVPSTQAETETQANTEEATSQLQLGSAVEIPEGWDGKLAETDAHEKLERVIAEYCGVEEKDYEKVRYYYNYVDLNGDSKNEILALVLAQEVPAIEGTTLLWIDDEGTGNISKDSVKQVYKHVGAPVYISNHMTEGYRDLILVDNATMSGGNATGETSGNEGSTEQTGTQQETPQDATGQAAATQGTVTEPSATQQTETEQGASGSNTPDAVGAQPKYTLLTWTGEKYQEMEEGTVLSNLDGQEGTAVLTNNMESDFANDNYHFLGEALR